MNWKNRNYRLPNATENSRCDIEIEMISDEEKYGEEELSPLYEEILYEQWCEKQMSKRGKDGRYR